VELQAGATFTALLLPQKNCDDSHWIIIRTSAADSKLPPEGTRLTPCYGGISSLPGRPNLNCKSTENVLAKIEFNGKDGLACDFAPEPTTTTVANNAMPLRAPA
jgi:hypothetical protein